MGRAMRQLGNSLVFGFAIALAMWCVWFLTHLPGLFLPPEIMGGLVVASMVLTGLIAGRSTPSRTGAWVVGGLAGLIASCVSLLVLGSFLVEPAAAPAAAADSTSVVPPSPGALRPAAGLAVLGFLALGSALGAISVFLGRLTRRRGVHADASHWLPRFAIVSAITVVPLLLIGGLVTSSGAGMAVPDWPATYNSNMFLYPIGLMTRPRIFLEHAHRLFGSFAGLSTLVLMVCTLASRQPKWAKIWSAELLVLVAVQGAIGGYRVTNSSTTLAMVHGITAQLFFGLMVAFAVAIHPLFSGLRRQEERGNPSGSREQILEGIDLTSATRFKVIATAAMHPLLLQLFLGAMYRHLRVPHALWAHMVFSLIIVVTASMAGFGALKLADQARHAPLRRTIRLIGAGIVVSVAVQFLLGWATWWVVQSSDRPLPTGDRVLDTPQVSTVAALLPTLHQANGALLLACVTMAFVWAIGLKRAAAAITPATPGPAAQPS